ncbi:AbgT family transporter, partial [Mycobacterium tuberculosis]|nr:AbgT family transporter [Mycobacterium tuberculosis]
ITTSVMETLPGIEYQAVNPVSNYYFNIVASIMLAIIAGFIIDKLIEPNMVRKGVPRDYVDATTQGLDKKYQATDVDYSENSVRAEELEAAQQGVSPTLE